MQYTEHWEKVIIIPITVEPMHSQFEGLKTSLLKDRNTLGVSALSEIPSKGKRVASLEWGRTGEKESTEVNVLFVSHEFLYTLELDMVVGRSFEKFMDDSSSFLINEQTARYLSNDKPPLGRQLTLRYNSSSYEGKVIGIVRDYRFRSPDSAPVPMVFQILPKEYRYLAIRTSDLAKTLALLHNLTKGPIEYSVLSELVTDLAIIRERRIRTIKELAICGVQLIFLLGMLLPALTNRPATIGQIFRVRGRIDRNKYIVLGLAGYVYSVLIVVTYLIFVDLDGRASHVALGRFFLLLSLATLLMAIITQAFIVVKRLHDIGRPGSHLWLLLIPLYNIYLGFLLLVKKGTSGENKYGQDPITAT